MSFVSGTVSSFPAEIREFAEFAVDDADTLSHAWLEAEQRGLTALERQERALRAGASAVARKLLSLSATNTESSLEHARNLINAERFSDMIRLHFEFFESQTRAIFDQLDDLGRIMTKAASVLAKS